MSAIASQIDLPKTGGSYRAAYVSEETTSLQFGIEATGSVTSIQSPETSSLVSSRSSLSGNSLTSNQSPEPSYNVASNRRKARLREVCMFCIAKVCKICHFCCHIFNLVGVILSFCC